ncbi:hypothetical protein [Ideonella paludis]|uniref:hypothetical protein n=1 Tax=Ideonella paludis TaxID=1233411 RepID=UPI00363FA165
MLTVACAHLSRWLVVYLALLLQGLCIQAVAQTALAWRPVSGTASTNYGAPYTMNRTTDSSEVSGSYTSGVTSFSTVEGYTTVGGGADGQWFGVFGTTAGDLIYDMGQSLFMDRVRFHWANAGGAIRSHVSTLTFHLLPTLRHLPRWCPTTPSLLAVRRPCHSAKPPLAATCAFAGPAWRSVQVPIPD